MKKLIFLLALNTTLGWAQSSEPIPPDSISLEFHQGAAPIRYYNSGLPVEISLQEAFGVSGLSSKNSAEINRIVNDVRANVLNPAGLSGTAIKMKYQNFISKDLIKKYKEKEEDLINEAEAKRQRGLKILDELTQSEKFIDYFNCEYILKNLIFTKTDHDKDLLQKSNSNSAVFDKCLNSIDFDLSKIKSIFKPNITSGELLTSIFQILSIQDEIANEGFDTNFTDHIKERLGLTTRNESPIKDVNQIYKDLIENDLLKSTRKCNAPRVCYESHITKEEFVHAVKTIFNKYSKYDIIQDYKQALLPIVLDLPRLKELNVTAKEIDNFWMYVDTNSAQSSAAAYYRARVTPTDIAEIYIHDKRNYTVNYKELELFTQNEINKWLKSLEWYDVAEYTDIKIGTLDIEQVMGPRDEYEDNSYIDDFQKALEIDRNVEIR